ncbi:MAG: hypothetical protein Q9167_000738 [Letrouitia subvulpina]
MAPPSSLAAATLSTRTIFDPWNSSTTGHQHAENRLAGSTSWRASRTRKLASQFKAGAGGGKRLYDTVGAGSESFNQDGRNRCGGREKDAEAPRESGWQDVRGLLEKSRSSTAAAAVGPETVEDTTARGKRKRGDRQDIERKEQCNGLGKNAAAKLAPHVEESEERRKKIFAGLRVYINGSTAPLVGDHRLKQILAEQGAEICIALARKSVTHVILGTPNNGTGQRGAGGGLAAGKIQKEIERIRGKGIKYVGVECIYRVIYGRLPAPLFHMPLQIWQRTANHEF